MDSTLQNLAPASSAELAGDLARLAGALGSGQMLSSLCAVAALVDTPRPETPAAVRAFLQLYRERLLTPIELPAIREAHELASRGLGLELIELDHRLAAQFGSSTFADASRHVGRTQLRRLRPLRDHTLQRYLRAVDGGQATGWHVVVYGLLLALFSLPLRQGLVHYAEKIQCRLLDSATAGLLVTAPEKERLRAECDAPIVPAVQQVLSDFTTPIS